MYLRSNTVESVNHPAAAAGAQSGARPARVQSMVSAAQPTQQERSAVAAARAQRDRDGGAAPMQVDRCAAAALALRVAPARTLSAITSVNVPSVLYITT